MSSHTIPTLKSPKGSNAEIKKLLTSPKTPKISLKAEHHTVNLFNESSPASKQSRPETQKSRIEIKTSPNNTGRLSLHKSRSPSSLKSDDQVSRLGMIKEYLSPTSQAQKSSLKAKKEANNNPSEIQTQESPAKETPVKLSARITLNKSKGADNQLSSKKSPSRITTKSEPETPVENKLHKRLASGVPTNSKLHDIEEERTLIKASSTARLDRDKGSLQNKKKDKVEAVTRNNPKISIQSRKVGESVSALTISTQGTTTRRLLSPQSQSSTNRKLLKSETPVNTGRRSVQSMSTPMNIKLHKNIEDESLFQDNLDVIKESNTNLESRNGSCSPNNGAVEKKTSRTKKLNVVIPTVQISTEDFVEIKQIKPSTTRAMFYNNIDISREDSPQPQGNKSARLIKALANASVDNKLDDKSKDLDQLSLFPSRNSEFSFQMKYFKPIEDSMLDQFIQTVNDSQKLKADNDGDYDSSKLSYESKPSLLKTDKSVKELPRLRVSTPALLTSPSMTSLSTKDKSSVNNATHSRHLSPQNVIRSSPRPRASETKVKNQGAKDEQLKRNFSPGIEPKVRIRSPVKKWEQVIPKSPPRNQSGISTNTAIRNSIDSKDGLSFVRNSFSRMHPKLAEEMESVPVELHKTKGTKPKNNQGDNKFSNLDKLLAQLRNNSKAKIEVSLPETEDSEKGLFNQSVEPEDESMNMSVNRSFARTFIKFNQNNP